VGTVTLVDPTTLAVEATVRAGDDERELVFGADAAWLADGNADTVSRIDPLTRDLEAFPMGGPVANVAVDSATGEVWVLLAEDEGVTGR
jgi:streptogramin lyase